MNVFTYGSLMFAPVWQRVVGGSYQSERACLADHARFTVRAASYPGVVPQAGAVVDGLLYLDVEPEALAVLDRFEGAEYARRPVTVACADGRRIEAATYIYLDRENLAEAAWTPADFDIAAFLADYCR
jgi:gamma-glutamylcyclotransferase (GGCT)/AIG2-like uncharacterized protein YtfP